MFSWTIFIKTLQSNLFLWMVVTFATTLFFNATIFAVDNLTSSGLTPPGDLTDSLSLLDQTFFSMIGILLPLIYIVVVSNRLIAKEVDQGSLAFVLTTQVSRETLIFTRGLFLFLSISAMMLILSLTGSATFQTLTMDVDLEVYGQIMFGLYALELSFAGINFLTSSLFNKTSLSIGFGAGISLGMFLLSTLSSLTSDLEPLRQFTLNQFFQVETIISGEANSLLNFSILLSVFVCLSLFGFQIFRKKNLPL